MPDCSDVFVVGARVLRHAAGRFWAALLVVSALAILTPTPVRTQEGRPTFSTSVAIVPITAIVRDGRGRLVANLARDDFQVLENSRPRQILDFRATDRGPVSLAVLVDTSGSMRGPNFSKGKDLVARLLALMETSADEAALFTFDKTFRQDTPFTREPDQVRRALDASDAWGLTSLYDAVAETAKRLAGRRAERHAVIVITDGIDTSSALTSTEVSGLASAIDVPVYVIAVEPPRHPDEGPPQTAPGLADLAFWTGGDLRYATTPEEATRTAADLMTELRQQYFLAIEASPASGWHSLVVKTKRRNFNVRTRGGYFASSALPE